MGGFVTTFKIKDKYKDNKFMSFYVDDDKLLENIKIFALRLKIFKRLH